MFLVGESTPGSSVTNFALSDSESSDDPGDEADIYEVDPSSTDGARVARAARAARRAGIKSPNENGNQFGYFEENIMTSRIVHRPRFLVCGKRGMGQSTHISPALLHSMEHIPVHSLDLPVLFGCLSKTAEEACAQVSGQKGIFSNIVRPDGLVQATDLSLRGFSLLTSHNFRLLVFFSSRLSFPCRCFQF